MGRDLVLTTAVGSVGGAARVSGETGESMSIRRVMTAGLISAAMTGIALVGAQSANAANCQPKFDSWGNARGNCNGQSYNLRQDSWGNTRGSIGGQSFSSRTDSWGNTRGTLGGESFSSRTDSWGNTRGSVGGNSFSCRTDSWGTTRC